MVTSEITAKLESLSTEDYNVIVSLVDRLAQKLSNVLRNARNKYVRENPMSMEEINAEIENYRSESIFFDTAKSCKARLITGNFKHYPTDECVTALWELKSKR